MGLDFGPEDAGGSTDMADPDAGDSGVAVDSGVMDAGMDGDMGGADGGGSLDGGELDMGEPDMGDPCSGQGPSRADMGVEWSEVYGTPFNDSAVGMASDQNGSLYVVGTTFGAFPGTNDPPMSDAYIQKRDETTGTVVWTHQFGSDSGDSAYAAAVRTVEGTEYLLVAGITFGTLGDAHVDREDVFVARITDSGGVRSEAWIHQFGTAEADYAFDVALDSEANSYVVGRTSTAAVAGAYQGSSDVLIRKLDSIGEPQWTKQFGTTMQDVALGVAVDPSDFVYVAGFTGNDPAIPSPASLDMFLRKYDGDGDLVWERVISDMSASGADVVVDPSTGDVYLGGTVNLRLGCRQFGSNDGVVLKYDPDGTLIWTHQFGSERGDGVTALAVGPGPSVYATGTGFVVDSADQYVHKIDGTNGRTVWTELVAAQSGIQDFAGDVVTDGSGNVYAVGYYRVLNNDECFVARLKP